MAKRRSDADDRSGKLVLIFVAVVVVLWVIYSLLLLFWDPALSPAGSPTLRGQFGDAFGALNALFSGLALAVVAGTLIVQRRDLKTQQEMLRGQLDEMGHHREEFRKQASIMDRHADLLEAQVYVESLKLMVEHVNRNITAYKPELHKLLNDLAARIEQRYPPDPGDG